MSRHLAFDFEHLGIYVAFFTLGLCSFVGPVNVASFAGILILLPATPILLLLIVVVSTTKEGDAVTGCLVVVVAAVVRDPTARV